MFNAVDWKEVGKTVLDWCKTSGLKILIGAIVLFIVFKITNMLSRSIDKKLKKKNTDKTVSFLVNNFFRKGLKIIWIILYFNYIGISTASVGTIIASLGVVAGLAVQGSLSNFAGGIVIFVMRPFRIGDFIVAQGESGTVESIHIFYTYLVTTDNRVVMIPNGTLANGTIINNSMKDTRRIDQKFGISYEADYDLAKKEIEDIIASYDEVLKDKDVFVKMTAHLDSAVEITTKIWVKSEDYWNVYYRLLEDVKRRFDEKGIEIPYNKIDVNLKK